jgi:hypothetical protein
MFFGLGLSQAHEGRPQKASETTKKALTFVSPGEGRYTYNFNEAFPDNNNVIFKWSSKTANAVLLVKVGDEILDEIKVKNTDHIKLRLSNYSSHRLLSWNLTVGENEIVVNGEIVLRKFMPQFNYLGLK